MEKLKLYPNERKKLSNNQESDFFFFFFLIGVKTPSAILSFRGYDHVGSNEVGVLQNAKENNFQRPAWEDVVLWYSLLMM